MSDGKVFDNDKTFGIAANIIEAIQFCEREIGNPPEPDDDAYVKAWKDGSINAAKVILQMLRPESSHLDEDTIDNVKRIKMLGEHLQSALHCAKGTLDEMEEPKLDTSDVEYYIDNAESALDDVRGALNDLDIEVGNVADLRAGASDADTSFDELIDLAKQILGD